MIEVTDEVKQAYDISTTQIDKIILEGKEYRITNVEFYDVVYDEGNIFGTAIGKSLEFEIENTIDLEGKEVEYQTGIIIKGITKWISLGNFIIQDIDPNDTTNIAKIFATDYMIKSNIPYKSKLLYQNNNITLLRVLQEVCENSDLQLATIDFANKDFVVDSNQFSEGTLNRQVIQAIAQLSGTIAKIKNDNKLYLINPNKITRVSKVFTLNNYEDAGIKRNTHPINLVSLAMKDIEGENITLRDEESITKNGENSLVINDNPFAYTQAKREQLITALFNAVKGFEYKSYSFKCQGQPYLETLDKIQFKDKKSNTYNSYIFRFNCKSPNGLESTIEAPSITKATINYQNIPSALDIAKKAEIRVNKAEQKITQLTQETTETSNKVAQVEQNVEGIKQSVSKTETKLEQVQSQTNLNTDEIARLGSTEIAEGQELTINASNNPAELKIWGNTINSVNVGDSGSLNIAISNEIGEEKIITFPFAEGQFLARGDFLAKDGIHKGNEIIPYTPEQQKVLDSIVTFKGMNHVYCKDEIKPEKMELEYYPNTPYNDTLVTKDTFDKVTTDMNAQINIKADEVETSVKEETTAQILTLLNNGYLTAEQVNALVNGNAEDIATVKEQLKQTVTSSQMQIEITKAIEGGVSYLKNALFTIDENGMAMATNQDEFNALYSNKGMYLYSFDELIAIFDVNGATIEGNLILNGELVTPDLRMMNTNVNSVPHVHIHWTGG